MRRSRIQLGGATYLAAGSYGFSSAWTRDAALGGLRGLLAEGDFPAVRRQLDLILQHSTTDGGAPRVIDATSISWRVVSGVIRRALGLPPPRARRAGRLRVQHRDEHGSPALDGGLLVIHAALDYVAASGDQAWLDANDDRLRRLLGHLRRYADADGLIVQPRYSDWQDSVKREGKTFYMNLLYVTAARRLGPRSGIPAARLARLERTLRERFFDRDLGLYRSIEGRRLISLDGNLLALDLGLVDPDGAAGRALYRALTRSSLWTRGGVPGSATIGDYPRSWPHLVSRLVGLTHYHDRMHWSWLVALSAKVAHRMGEPAEADRILAALDRMGASEDSIGEIYAARGGEGGPLRPFRSWLYRSARDFTWGAGMVLDALQAIDAPVAR